MEDGTTPWPDYLAAIGARLSSKYEFIADIAPGKTGQTYKITEIATGHPFCLKTIAPTVRDHTERESVRTTLKKEVQILRPLSHRCLPTIFEHDLDLPLPFYVCTYHPGQTWKKFRQSGGQLKSDESVYLISALIDAVEYLHSS